MSSKLPNNFTFKYLHEFDVEIPNVGFVASAHEYMVEVDVDSRWSNQLAPPSATEPYEEAYPVVTAVWIQPDDAAPAEEVSDEISGELMDAITDQAWDEFNSIGCDLAGDDSRC